MKLRGCGWILFILRDTSRLEEHPEYRINRNNHPRLLFSLYLCFSLRELFSQLSDQLQQKKKKRRNCGFMMVISFCPHLQKNIFLTQIYPDYGSPSSTLPSPDPKPPPIWAYSFFVSLTHTKKQSSMGISYHYMMQTKLHLNRTKQTERKDSSPHKSTRNRYS